MNNYIEFISNKYKPLKYVIRGKAINFTSTLGDYVLKPKKKDIKKLYNYLDSRSFNSYDDIVEVGNDYYLYEYLKDTFIPKEQKIQDLIRLIAKLHRQTIYFKEVNNDKYKEIYDNLKDNIKYLQDYYSNMYDEYFNIVIPSPSKEYFLENYSLINNSLLFLNKEIDEWFKLVENSNKQRVSLIHNNLSLDHFIENREQKLISWDNYTFDTPILDLVTLYKKEHLNIPFKDALQEYLSILPLNKDELKLFFILICIPNEISLKYNEFTNCTLVYNLVNDIILSEALIRPYYTEEKKE